MGGHTVMRYYDGHTHHTVIVSRSQTAFICGGRKNPPQIKMEKSGLANAVMGCCNSHTVMGYYDGRTDCF